MDTPIDAKVQCVDGPCGKSTRVVLNPTSDEVTHLVVRERSLPHAERLVPMNLVMEAAPEMIRLRCTEKEFGELDSFVETAVIKEDVRDYAPGAANEPYVVPDSTEVKVEEESVPANELAVRRGARVEATDGQVGQVDEFLIDPRTGRISHLVLREGHLWGQKDVTIPVSEIDVIAEDAVYLKLDRESVEALPAVPVRRSIL